MSTIIVDPFVAAMNPPAQEFEIFGQVEVIANYVMLVKGVGKLPWEENTVGHDGKPTKKYTAIDIDVTALEEAESQFPTTSRSMLAEFGEWKEIVLPSLRDCGVTDLAGLNKKFCKCVLQDTGRTYQGRDGSTKSATTFKFLAIYNTREECVAAYSGGDPAVAVAAAPVQATFAPATAPGNGNGNERDTALKFLKAFVQNAARKASRDPAQTLVVLEPMINTNPMLAKYFTVQSDEVMQLVAEEVAPF